MIKLKERFLYEYVICIRASVEQLTFTPKVAGSTPAGVCFPHYSRVGIIGAKYFHTRVGIIVTKYFHTRVGMIGAKYFHTYLV